MKDKEAILAGIKMTLTEHAEEIAAAGPFGSEEDDLDVLVILKEPDVEAGERICRALRHVVPEGLFYPTFRVESLLAANEFERKQKVHLLLYPSLAVFRCAERGFVRYCITKSFVPWVGNRPAFCQGEERRPEPDIPYYLELLFETMQIYLMESLSPEASLREARKKLMYIIKFACLEVFYEDGSKIDLRRVAETLFLHELPPVLNRAAALYSEVRLWNNPLPERVMSAFSETVTILKQLSEAP
jgi:hypothetical protein